MDSQPTVSQHLAELKRVGLIVGQIEGPRSCHCLGPDAVAAAARAFSGLFEEIVTEGEERHGTTGE